MEEKKISAPILKVLRHRINTDGKGVATLVGFYGCPLRCRYCLNPQSFAPDTRTRIVTPEELYEQVRIDELYFLASGGGVTFGGGEPLLHPEFIAEFRKLCGESWHICAETCLSVPEKNVELAASVIDTFFVDCKDSNGEIYRSYTGKSNSLMLENLRCLVSLVGKDRIVVRVPLIPGYNTDSDREASMALFRSMGLENFDLFTYKTDNKKNEPAR